VQYDDPPSSTRSTRDVAALIAPTVGWEKSEELIRTTAEALGFDPSRLAVSEVGALFAALSREAGIVGVAARFARSRLVSTPEPAQPDSREVPRSSEQGRASQPDPPRSGERTRVSHDSPTRSGSGEVARISHPELKRLPRTDLAQLLARTIGEEKALEEVVSAARQAHVDSDPVTLPEALLIFEQLAAREGLVGVTARFAKARLVFKFRE
jgi:hypothetical protein